MSSRRDVFQRLSATSAEHAGLWLDKFIRTQSHSGDDVDTKRNLVGETAQIVASQPVLDLYRHSFQRWRQALERLPDTELRFATVRGRVVIGLGGESVLETAVTLHRSYGLPYIPGSALKGLAAAYARQRLDAAWEKPGKQFDPQAKDDKGNQRDPTAYEVLFGATSTAGYVTFHDALWDGEGGRGGRSLFPDVLTVHHQAYYNQGGQVPPADWDSPVPIPFLSASGRFLIALSGPAEWRARAFDILGRALDELGIGAKTSSGYGHMDLEGLAAAPDRRSGQTSVPVQHAAPPADGQAAPQRSTRSIPSVGAVFAGTVLERAERTILISVPGHASQAVIATLAIAEDTPNWQVGNLARVEVVSVEDRGGRTILMVRRAPKAKKS